MFIFLNDNGNEYLLLIIIWVIFFKYFLSPIYLRKITHQFMIQGDQVDKITSLLRFVDIWIWKDSCRKDQNPKEFPHLGPSPARSVKPIASNRSSVFRWASSTWSRNSMNRHSGITSMPQSMTPTTLKLSAIWVWSLNGWATSKKRRRLI